MYSLGCEDSLDQTKDQKVRGKEGRLIKIKNVTPEVADATAKSGIKISVGRRNNEVAVRTATEVPATRGGSKLASTRNSGGDGPSSGDDFHEDRDNTRPMQKDSRTLLKLKFKNPYSDGPSGWAPSTDDEKFLIKGQRSKRKRPPSFGEKASANAEMQWPEDNSFDELMDANWILQKLGKDAIGKRVEVHEPSNNTW